MDLGHAVLKGIVQGLTEFLPVSSTAHLIFTDALAKLLGWQTQPPLLGEEEFYDILLHLGTLVAVIVYFRQELAQIFQSLFNRQAFGASSSMAQPGWLSPRKIPFYLMASMTLTVGFILFMLKGSESVMGWLGLTSPQVKDLSDFYLQHPQWVAFHLMITGCLLFFTEQLTARSMAISLPNKGFSMKNALIIGFSQGCAAIFHGISRSGSTISAGLASGLDRVTATRYSFLLSIPTFTMAALYETLKVLKLGSLSELNWPVMLVGTVLSGLVGYFCVKYFIQFVARHTLTGFAVYCWIVGGMMWFIFR